VLALQERRLACPESSARHRSVHARIVRPTPGRS
jgi:hypothetical protein